MRDKNNKAPETIKLIRTNTKLSRIVKALTKELLLLKTTVDLVKIETGVVHCESDGTVMKVDNGDMAGTYVRLCKRYVFSNGIVHVQTEGVDPGVYEVTPS